MFSFHVPTTVAELRSTIGSEYQAVSAGINAEIHKFLDFVEQKGKKLDEAKALLEANGFDVTVHVAPPPAPAA